jgi:hypothetical protein
MRELRLPVGRRLTGSNLSLKEHRTDWVFTRLPSKMKPEERLIGAVVKFC